MARSFAFDGEGHARLPSSATSAPSAGCSSTRRARRCSGASIAIRTPMIPSVQAGKRRGAANNAAHFSMAAACWRSRRTHRPWEVDPVDVLETVGRVDLRGQTAQSDRDRPSAAAIRPPVRCMASDTRPRDLAPQEQVSYFVTNAKGELIREEIFKVPYCALMHDFVVTKEHVVFPGFPIVADLERMKAGGDPLGMGCDQGVLHRHHAGQAATRGCALVPCARLLGIPFHQRLQRRQQVHMDMCVSSHAGIRVHAQGLRPAHSAVPGRRRSTVPLDASSLSE